MFGNTFKRRLPTADEALPGRDRPVSSVETHYVNGNRIRAPFPDGIETAVFGLGWFWGAEKAFWQIPGVDATAVGYAGGLTPNPTYEEVCSGRTGHAEVVLVAYDPAVVTYESLLATFWETHDPTQAMAQGGDVGTQYRSAIFTTSPAQADAAAISAKTYQERLTEAGFREITTEIAPVGDFFYAEDYHQQYLAKNPGGYCGLGGTGVTCPTGLST